MTIERAAEILGISLASYTESELKNAHRDGVRKYHPDNTGEDNHDKFDQVNEAYEVLKEELRRRTYYSSSSNSRSTQSNTNPKPENNEPENTATKKTEPQNTDEYILGTNIKKPRVRMNYETDEEYVKYLEDYYTKAFANIKNSNAQNNNDSKSTSNKYDNISDEELDKKIQELLEKEMKNSSILSSEKMAELRKEIDELETEQERRKSNNKSSEQKEQKPEPLMIEDKHKNPPQIEQKPEPLMIEDKHKKPPQIEQKPEPLMIEDKHKNPPQVEKEQVIGYKQVIGKIIKPHIDENGNEIFIGMSSKDKRYTAANIKIKPMFKQIINRKEGNIAYDLNPKHIVQNVARIPVAAFQKLKSNFFLALNPEDKKRIEIMEERAKNLTYEEAKVLYEFYTFNNQHANKMSSYLDQLLSKAVYQKYIYPETSKIEAEVNKKVVELFSIKEELNDIDELLKDQGLSSERRQELQQRRTTILTGCTEKIQFIRDKMAEGNKLLSHGFRQDIQAKNSKMNYEGKRFAKGERNIDSKEAYEEWLKEVENESARLNGNDEEALNAFIAEEVNYQKNTKIKKGLLGKYSKGDMDASRRYILQEADYRNDPLIADLIGSIAIISQAASVINGIKVTQENEALRNAHNEAINQTNQYNRGVNARNANAEQQVKGSAQSIMGTQQDMVAGAEAVSMGQGSLLGQLKHEFAERAERSSGSSYGKLDKEAHEFYAQYMNDTTSTISQIQGRLQSGNISGVDALLQYGQLNSNTINELSSCCKQYSQFLQQYVATSKWDYTGTLKTVEYFSNPTAIEKMFSAMANAQSEAEFLNGINIEMAKMAGTMGELSNNIPYELAAAFTTAGLVFYTSNKLNEQYETALHHSEAQDKIKEYIKKQEEKEVKKEQQVENKKSKREKIKEYLKNFKQSIVSNNQAIEINPEEFEEEVSSHRGR